jgi:hypothetical protein
VSTRSLCRSAACRSAANCECGVDDTEGRPGFTLQGYGRRSIVSRWSCGSAANGTPVGSVSKKATVQKLVLMSVIFASIIIAARAARMKSAHAGLKKTLVQAALYNLFYVFLLMYVVGRL